MQNLDLALVILVAGLVVVFFMLIVLILIIKLYGSIIYNRQKSKSLRESKTNKIDKEVSKKEAPKLILDNKEDENEIIAVISAAVAFLEESESKQYNITSIKQSQQKIYKGQSLWGIAGRFEMTKPF